MRRFRHVPTAVILIAQEDDPELARKAIELGAYGYVVEPPWPGQLLTTAVSALRQRELVIAQRERDQENLDLRRREILATAPIAIHATELSGGQLVVANDTAVAAMQRGELVGHLDEAFVSPKALESEPGSDRRDPGGQQTTPARKDAVEIGELLESFRSIRFPLRDESGEIRAVGAIAVCVTAAREAVRLRDERAEGDRGSAAVSPGDDRGARDGDRDP